MSGIVLNMKAVETVFMLFKQEGAMSRLNGIYIYIHTHAHTETISKYMY